MLTRCPRCDTTFRVTPEQLKARHGRVRCGHCQDAFNALDTLIEAPPQPGPVEPAAEEVPLPPAPPTEEPEPAPEPETEPPETELPPESCVVAANEPFAEEPPAEPAPIEAPAPSIEDTVTEAPPVAAPTLPAAELAAPEPDAPEIPPLEPLLHEAPKRRAWPWALGAFAALAVLLLQAAIHYRTEIATLYPSTKPLLLAFCAPFGCDVPLPRKAELVGIESSNLSPDAGGKLALAATLKNRAPFVQQYPDLELTLTDTNDQPLVRRVLAPADYLPPATDVGAGFGARGEIAVNLLVEAPGVPAAGYQLYLFYP